MRNHLDPRIQDFLVHASKNLFNAAQSGDSDLAEAVMVNMLDTLPSYIQAIREDRRDNAGR